MKAKILELFKSIQGEGKYAGVQQVFVRFFECNMHCSWCDTPHSIGDTTRRFNEYDLKELLTKIKDFYEDSHSVSLTGGEPLMQTDFIKMLLPELKKEQMPVHLETNGVYPEQLERVINDIDVVAMDIKLPSSTKCKSYWDEHRDFLDVARQKEVFIKTVITSDTDQCDIEHAVNMVAGIDADILFFLQPNSFELKNGVMQRCLEFHRICNQKLNNVRVLPQAHKIMKIR